MLDKAELMTSSHALPIKIMLSANFVLRQCIFFKATAQCTMGLYQFSRSNIIVLIVRIQMVQYTLDLRKPNLRKNLNLRKIVATTDFLVHKMFDLRKIF